MILHFRYEQECAGKAYAQTDLMCPSEVGHNWRYDDGTSWPDAGKGLIVQCISETGKLRTKYKATFPFSAGLCACMYPPYPRQWIMYTGLVI